MALDTHGSLGGSPGPGQGDVASIISCEVSSDTAEDPKKFDFAFAFNNSDFADRVIELHVTSEDEQKVDSIVLTYPAAAAAAASSAVPFVGGLFAQDGQQRPLPHSSSSAVSTSSSHSNGSHGSSPRAGEDCRGSNQVLELEAAAGVGGGADASLPDCAASGEGSAFQGLPGAPPAVDASSTSASLSSVAVFPMQTHGRPAQRVISLHLSSVVLAAKSSFFRTLFTCGLKETGVGHPVILSVTHEEELSVIELLRFIYTGDMRESSSEPEELIKMFLVADKFGVASCMRICLQRLAALPMTVSTACLYLSLPDSMHQHRGVAQLLDASRLFLVSHFRDLERVHTTDEFLELPMVGLQTLLASDELNVREEMTAFSALLHWVRHHFDNMNERRCATSKLAQNVRFPLMTGDDLEEVVLRAEEMKCLEGEALVREAAWFRAYSLVRRLRLMNESAAVHRRFWQRRWNRNSVGHVYFDIHLERFQALAVAATVESATFGIGGKRFYLSARHGRRDDGTETLDIHLHLENSHSIHPEIQVSFIFYAKRWPEGQFDFLRDRVTKGFGRNASNWGYSNILGKPWADVVQDNSKYFHHGVMSVFAEVMLLENDGKTAAACTGS